MDGNTLEVAYEYADGSGDNTARRTAVIYPNEAASPNPALNRKVNLLYPATADDRLSRVGALKIEGDAGNLCDYTFVGLARYVKIVYVEPAVQLSYIKTGSQPVGDAGDPYTGYDRFGRTVDMRWEAASGGAIRIISSGVMIGPGIGPGEKIWRRPAVARTSITGMMGFTR